MRERERLSVVPESWPACAQGSWMTTLLTAPVRKDDTALVKRMLGELLRRARRPGCAAVELEQQLRAIADAFLFLRLWAFGDELTGLLNRRGFLLVSSRMLERAAGESAMAALIYADIDNLKLINDSLGHSAGDSLLQRSAELLRKVVGNDAVIGRLGGDEFAALQRLNRSGGSAEILHRIREAVEVCNSAKGMIPLSVSVGCAEFEPLKPVSILNLRERADSAMYRSKSRRARRFECGSR
jgi:diguanylate cyclase (GGDEF)-like protein